MIFWYSPWDYLAGLLVWIICLAGLLRVLLLRRRAARRQANLRRLRWSNIGLSCWVFVGLFTGCELAFALFVDHTDAANTTNISQRWIRRHIDGEQNNAGFRDSRDFSKKLPKGVRRICFFGDSFTVGHGVKNMRDRFSDRIAARLEEVHPQKFVVANLGVLGYETSLIESLVRAAIDKGNEIDTVVYVFMMNDIEGFDPRTTQIIQEMHQDQPKSFLINRTYFLNWLYFRLVLATGPRAGAYFPNLVDA